MYTKFYLAKNIEVLRNIRGAVFLSKRTLYVYNKKRRTWFQCSKESLSCLNIEKRN